MKCTLGPLVDEANAAALAAYTICEVDPSGLQLSPEDLEIVEEGSWCQDVPTYTVPDIAGYLPTIVADVKDVVYDELWANLQAEISTLATNAAMTYSTKLERVNGDESVAGQLSASYAQWESGSSALATSVQTALASQDYALSQQILATEASLDGKITANSQFYQTSLASVGETMAASGVLNSVTLADGKKVVSGFRSQASSTTGSEFTIFADTFKILNRVPNGSGGYDYSSAKAPFTVQNDTVYIGEVDTSKPQITLLGDFASAPSTVGLSENTVYKNTTDGNSYRFNGTSWVLFIAKGTNGTAGTNGSNGTRGSIHITVNGTYSNGGSTSSAFQSATSLSDKVIGDWVTFNSASGATDYYRNGNGSDTWINAALYVNGNLIVTGSISSSSLNVDAITACRIYVSDSNQPGYDVFRSYFTTQNSAIALGGVHSASNFFGTGIYGRTDSNIPHSSGVNGVGMSSGVYGVHGTTNYGTGVYGDTQASGYGVVGEALSSSGMGVVGKGVTWAVHGDTTASDGSWGFITYDRTYSGGGYMPFTGAHIAYSLDSSLVIGDLVSAEKTFGVTVDQTYAIVNTTTTVKDKKVLGVVSYINKEDVIRNFLLCKATCTKEEIVCKITDPESKEVRDKVVDTLYVPKLEYAEYANILVTDKYAEVGVNAVGEGMINVCSEGGDIEIGDYLCSSNTPGKAMKQDDDLLHNYTAAKATQGVIWNKENSTTKMIACTYHAG